MIKKLAPLGILSLFLLFSVAVSAGNNSTKSKSNETPEEITSIIKKSCFGCHNAESQNDKAKEKLDFKALENLTGPDKVHALREIAEVVEEDDMPPKKFLDRNPDKALSSDEKKALIEWAKKEAKSLMN